MNDFALTTYSRVDGFRTLSGETHLCHLQAWGPGKECSDEWVEGKPEGVLVREISCDDCLDSLPGMWEVQVPDKRFKTGTRTLYTGFAHEKGAQAAAAQAGRRDAVAVGITMRELLEMEKENP